jgi:hypothetical protein
VRHRIRRSVEMGKVPGDLHSRRLGKPKARDRVMPPRQAVPSMAKPVALSDGVVLPHAVIRQVPGREEEVMIRPGEMARLEPGPEGNAHVSGRAAHLTRVNGGGVVSGACGSMSRR